MLTVLRSDFPGGNGPAGESGAVRVGRLEAEFVCPLVWGRWGRTEEDTALLEGLAGSSEPGEPGGRWVGEILELRDFATGSEGSGPVGGATEGREGRGREWVVMSAEWGVTGSRGAPRIPTRGVQGYGVVMSCLLCGRRLVTIPRCCLAERAAGSGALQGRLERAASWCRCHSSCGGEHPGAFAMATRYRCGDGGRQEERGATGSRWFRKRQDSSVDGKEASAGASAGASAVAAGRDLGVWELGGRGRGRVLA